MMRPAAQILWVLTISGVVGLSLVPGKMLPPLTGAQTALGHGGFYLVLTLLSLQVFERKSIAVVHSLLLSFGLEYLQEFVDGRGFETFDLYANSVGLIIGLLLGNLFRLSSPTPLTD